MYTALHLSAPVEAGAGKTNKPSIARLLDKNFNCLGRIIYVQWFVLKFMRYKSKPI